MRVVHTADWHIGQALNGWSREHEHRDFLAQLHALIVAQEVDALLVAGDVFDGINPSGEAQRLLYGAIARLKQARPQLQIILTAGNHDPAQRLEAPEAVLNALGVHVLGTLRRGPQGVDIARHLIPLHDAQGVLRAHVLAIPFLRQADLGVQLGAQAEGEPVLTAAVRALHHELVAAALPLAQGLPLLAMGHLTCAGGLASEGAERRILIGGEQAVPPDVFPPELAYVALGHLHKPQSLDHGRLRYSGSPFPLSASEINYNHGVTLVELGAELTHRHVELARPVPMLRLPKAGTAPLEEVLAALQALKLSPQTPRAEQPFLYLALQADRPATEIKTAIDALIETLPVRLAGLTIQREAREDQPPPPASLAETTPEELFCAAFAETHGTAPSPQHLAAFRDALSEV